jgi:hypothetical protein
MDEQTQDVPRHAAVEQFVEQFAHNPKAACDTLVERSNPRVDTATLANLVFKTAELDKSQIGNLLASDQNLLKGYMELFPFADVRIDTALRMLLLSLRLPSDSLATERLLAGFADQYWIANNHRDSLDKDALTELMKAVIQLNDALYGMYGFATPNHAVTADIWISTWKGRDIDGIVPYEVLERIYNGVRAGRLDQALSQEEKHREKKIEVIPKVPARLTLGTWSNEIRIKVEQPNDKLRIRLSGEGLEFEPEWLDFSENNEVGFRVRGSSLGIKSIFFYRVGHDALVPSDTLFAAQANQCIFIGHYMLRSAMRRPSQSKGRSCKIRSNFLSNLTPV